MTKQTGGDRSIDWSRLGLIALARLAMAEKSCTANAAGSFWRLLECISISLFSFGGCGFSFEPRDLSSMASDLEPIEDKSLAKINAMQLFDAQFKNRVSSERCLLYENTLASIVNSNYYELKIWIQTLVVGFLKYFSLCINGRWLWAWALYCQL